MDTLSNINKPFKRKKYKLSKQDKEYVLQNFKHISVNEIANHLGCTVGTVKGFIERTQGGTVLEETTLSPQEEGARQILRSREYWKQLKQQFNSTELKTFEQIWIKLWLQFNGDVLASEEIQMKKYITLEIMKDRFGKQSFKCLKDIERLQNLLHYEYNKPSKNLETIKNLTALLEKQQKDQLEFARHQRDTIAEQKDVEKALRVSRDDRVKNIQDATQNWTSIIKLLNENHQIREQIGRQIEIMRIAKDHAKQFLSEYHQYHDKSIDQPLLSEDTIQETQND